MNIIDLLMTLQYDFPIHETPFRVIASKFKIGEDKLIQEIKNLKSNKIIRRIGSVLNYRSRRLEAALVALEVPEPYVEDIAHHINNLGGISHNFLRNHKFNIWFVIKRKSIKDIISEVRDICNRYPINNFVILKSCNTYRLDVRFDLHKGISRAKILRQNQNPPRLEEVSKIPIEALKEIKDIDVCERPFEKVANKYNIDSKLLIFEIRKLIDYGVLRDFYAVLNQDAIGFKTNAMIVIKNYTDDIDKILKLEEPTHIVYREQIYSTDPSVNLSGIYLMLHAKDASIINDYVHDKLRNYKREVILSMKNLLPEMPHDIEYFRVI